MNDYHQTTFALDIQLVRNARLGGTLRRCIHTRQYVRFVMAYPIRRAISRNGCENEAIILVAT